MRLKAPLLTLTTAGLVLACGALAAGDLEEARLPAVLAALDECSTRFPVRLESFTVIEVTLPHYPRLGTYPYQSAE